MSFQSPGAGRVNNKLKCGSCDSSSSFSLKSHPRGGEAEEESCGKEKIEIFFLISIHISISNIRWREEIDALGSFKNLNRYLCSR
eukprot:scaffold15698_cov154-Skeletonema_marinoi.AAC.8